MTVRQHKTWRRHHFLLSSVTVCEHFGWWQFVHFPEETVLRRCWGVLIAYDPTTWLALFVIIRRFIWCKSLPYRPQSLNHRKNLPFFFRIPTYGSLREKEFFSRTISVQSLQCIALWYWAAKVAGEARDMRFMIFLLWISKTLLKKYYSIEFDYPINRAWVRHS